MQHRGPYRLRFRDRYCLSPPLRRHRVQDRCQLRVSHPAPSFLNQARWEGESERSISLPSATPIRRGQSPVTDSCSVSRSVATNYSALVRSAVTDTEDGPCLDTSDQVLC